MPAAVAISKTDVRMLQKLAKASFPFEACALLVGENMGDVIRVTGIAAAENVAANPAREFEIDPQLILRLQKDMRDSEQEIVGVFHSHPTASAMPSETDLSRAWYPDFVWLIASVPGGRIEETKAHRLIPCGDKFEELDLQVK